MSIILFGDIHGNMNKLKEISNDKSINNIDNVIIFLGDFGFTWSYDHMRIFNEYTDKYFKCEILFIDGNHENFDILSELNSERMFGSYVHKFGKKCYHLKRGNIYEIQGKKFICFGGAHSIDHNRRIEGISWWKKEEPNDIDKLSLLMNKESDFDYVLSHTCPNEIVKELGINFVLDNCKTRNCLDALLNKNFKKWYFGHWHIDKEIVYNDKQFRCLYKELEILI